MDEIQPEICGLQDGATKASRGWGGARRGAGRPRKPEPPKPMSLEERLQALFADRDDAILLMNDPAPRDEVVVRDRR